jgi:hypothetical protein
MIAGQENDGVALQLKELLPQVTQSHREQLCKRNKFGKHEICSPSTLFNYMDKGEVKNPVLGRHIYNALKKIVDNN